MENGLQRNPSLQARQSALAMESKWYVVGHKMEDGKPRLALYGAVLDHESAEEVLEEPKRRQVPSLNWQIFEVTPVKD